MQRISFLLILLVLSLSFACQKVFEKPRWNTDIVAPLIKTSLGVEDILKDTSFVADGDTVKFVSRQKLYDFNLDSLIKLTVKPFNKNVKLSKLKLSPQQVVRVVSLGELAKAMQADGNAMGTFIINFNGFTVPVTDIADIKAGPLDVDINQFFEYAVMNNPGGIMNIKIDNGLPLNISRIEFELENKTLATPAIAHETFLNINAGTSQNRNVDLSDKTMEGNQVVYVRDMDIQGGTVKIDTSDAITITLTVSNLSVKEATAVFPAQDVVDEKYEEPLQGFNGPSAPRLRLAKIQYGKIEAEAYSTSEDTVYFTYNIPSATKSGMPFQMKTIIRPTPPGTTIHEEFQADFADYELDLKGKAGHDTNNTFYNELKARIEYTGRKVHMSLDDSIKIQVQLKDIIPFYVEGYLGQDTVDTGLQSTDLNIFNDIQSGILNFEKVKIDLVVENGMGVDGEVVLKNIQAVNTRTGQTKTLNNLPITGIIQKAIKTPYASVTTRIPLSTNNAIDLLNILPDKINYNAEIRVNNTVFNDMAPVYNDFAYKSSALNPYLDIELPLSISANQLVLVDTADFVSANFQTSVNSGSFTVLVENGFPMKANLKLYFLDQGGIAMDSVVNAGDILSGIVDGNNRVIEKKLSKLTFYVDESRMNNILRARKVIFKVNFSSVNYPGFVKIYTDYTMDFKLVGDFNYTIK